MYIQSYAGLGQKELPSTYGTPCLQDDTAKRLEFALFSDTVSKSLDEFNFRESRLRTWHKTWIKRRFVPAVVASWRTSKPIQTIILVGHADEVGEPSINYRLGKDRAAGVANELKTQLEAQSPGLISKITIETYSAGECWPLIKGGKRERRNRYVTVWGVKGAVSTPTPVKPKVDTPVPNVWYTRPLPHSEFHRFEKAIKDLEARIAATSDPRKWRYLCWIAKLKDPRVDDRIIQWDTICPRVSGAIGAAFIVGSCSLGHGVDQKELERSIHSVSDVETANQSLQFITYMRSSIVVSFEMTTLPLENLRNDTDGAGQAIDKLNKWANNPMGGSSAMPPAYRALKDWIMKRQKDPLSLYSCF